MRAHELGEQTIGSAERLSMELVGEGWFRRPERRVGVQHLLHDVHELEPGTEAPGHERGMTQRERRVLREIDRHHDFVEHRERAPVAFYHCEAPWASRLMAN